MCIWGVLIFENFSNLCIARSCKPAESLSGFPSQGSWVQKSDSWDHLFRGFYPVFSLVISFEAVQWWPLECGCSLAYVNIQQLSTMLHCAALEAVNVSNHMAS
jgi:hypothetical protein